MYTSTQEASNPHTGNTMKPVILKADMNLIDSGKQTVISLKETRAAYIVTVKALRKNSNLDNAFIRDAPERLEDDDRSDIDLYTWDVTYDIFEATDCDYTPITWANIPAIDAWISEVAQSANTRNTKEINKIKEPVKVDTTNTACIVDTGSKQHPTPETPTMNPTTQAILTGAIQHTTTALMLPGHGCAAYELHHSMHRATCDNIYMSADEGLYNEAIGCLKETYRATFDALYLLSLDLPLSFIAAVPTPQQYTMVLEAILNRAP